MARAPLPNLDSLVCALVPGAEITTEGLLLQLADEELVVMAYALEQIASAASTRLVKDLEQRDELRSTSLGAAQEDFSRHFKEFQAESNKN